ncbi:MAG: hypothetical protein AAF804_13520 [Bacteroidota bacterium]
MSFQISGFIDTFHQIQDRLMPMVVFRFSFILITLYFCLSNPSFGQTLRVTVTGDTLVVYPDGSWKYQNQPGAPQPLDKRPPLRTTNQNNGSASSSSSVEESGRPGPIPTEIKPQVSNFSNQQRAPEYQSPDASFPVNPFPYKRPQNADHYLEDPKGRFRLWYDGLVWQPISDENGQLSMMLVPSRGQALALLTMVDQSVDLKALVEQTVADAATVSSQVRIVSQEFRTVNDRFLLFVRLDGLLQNQNYTYYSYYRKAKDHTLQLTVYAPREVFLGFQAQIADLLNGLVVP